jgi:hypothetical protein
MNQPTSVPLYTAISHHPSSLFFPHACSSCSAMTLVSSRLPARSHHVLLSLFDILDHVSM